MIYLDFDGTINDIWERYYQVFICASHHSVSENEYILAKNSLEKDDAVAEYFNFQLPDDYYIRKKELLEDESLLRKDTLLVEPTVLIDFVRSSSAKILTMRRNEDSFFRQLEYLGLSGIKDRCIVLSPDCAISKSAYLRENGETPIVVVGDSANEYQVAQEDPNSQVYLVSTGLQNPERFPILPNCHIVNGIKDFIRKNS